MTNSRRMQMAHQIPLTRTSLPRSYQYCPKINHNHYSKRVFHLGIVVNSTGRTCWHYTRLQRPGSQMSQRAQDYGESTATRRPGPTFDPPVYRQRYSKVYEIVKKYNAKRVLDFGCAEGRLLRFLINGETGIEELVGVDIDGDLLKESTFRIKPLTTDYLIPRSAPLTVSMYQVIHFLCHPGSISEADDRFCSFDVVACVEIVEHLIPDHLEAMPNVLLGQLAPKVAIVTTPNADFNVLFPDLEGFRHWDHKFEWTRSEFQDWAKVQAERHDYSVTFDGIGYGPSDTDHLGCCSQMALFERLDMEKHSAEQTQFGQPYNLIVEIEHPYRKCTISEEDKILYEVDRLLWFLSQPSDYEQDSEENYDDEKPKSFMVERLFEIPSLQRLCGTLERLQSVLQSSKLEMTEDGNCVLWCPSGWSTDDSDDEPDWDTGNDSTSVTCDACSSEISKTQTDEQQEENWDDDDDDRNDNYLAVDNNVCWTADNDAGKYWNVSDNVESGSPWTEDQKDIDDNLCQSDEEFRVSLTCGWQGMASNGDGDDDKDWDCTAPGDECDGMVWIVPDNSTKELETTHPSN